MRPAGVDSALSAASMLPMIADVVARMLMLVIASAWQPASIRTVRRGLTGEDIGRRQQAAKSGAERRQRRMLEAHRRAAVHHSVTGRI